MPFEGVLKVKKWKKIEGVFKEFWERVYEAFLERNCEKVKSGEGDVNKALSLFQEDRVF